MDNHNPKIALKVLNFFLRSSRRVQVHPKKERTMSPDEIKRIYQRAFIRLKAIYRLNKLSQEIVKYGTSSNLFDLSTRDRPALQKYLFPLTKVLIEEQQIEFPIIHPTSMIRKCWSILFIFIMIYTATILPFRCKHQIRILVAFMFIEDQYWNYIDIAVDLLYWIDLVINMLSAYYDEEGKLVQDRKTVITNYIKTWFIFDFMACFPVDYITNDQYGYQQVCDYQYRIQAQDNRDIGKIKLLRLPKLLRLVKMTRVLKVAKGFGKSGVLDLFRMNYGFTRLSNLFMSVCILVHFMGCIWYFNAAYDSQNINTWIYRNQLQDSDVLTQYIASIYYSFTTLTTVGYGDIHSSTTAEMIITIVFMIVGVCFYSFTIGLLSSVLLQIDYKAHKLSKKKAILNEFCKEKKISKLLRDRLKETLENNFSKNCFIWADNQNIFSDLPINLRYDIMMNIHGGVFGAMQLFQLVDDKAFLVKVVPLLKPLIMQEEEFLWESKSNPDALYFLADGRVNFKSEFVILAQTNRRKMFSFKSMISGSYFGDIEIFLHIPREFHAVCESRCELYYLSLDDFENHIYDEFPHVMDKMKKIAQDRHSKNLETISQLQMFIDDETTARDRRVTRVAKRKTLLRDLIDPKKEDIKPKFQPKPRQSKKKISDLVLLTQEIQNLIE
ncbi:hypothetical protein pb186bvf_020367 [Paramecium bursaria]